MLVSQSSHTDSKKKMSEDHDKPLCVWQASVSESGSGPHHPYVYIIVGDNIDKCIAPRNMRLEHKVSLHYFHAFAALSRVETPTLMILGQLAMSKTTFLLSPEDCSVLRDTYVILVSRTLVQHLTFLQPFTVFPSIYNMLTLR